MSAPSRPHRRLSLALPTGLSAPAPPPGPPPKHEAPEEPRPRGRAGAPSPAAEKLHPHVHASHISAPGRVGSRLTLTQSTGMPAPEVAVPELPVQPVLPIHKRVLPKDSMIVTDGEAQAKEAARVEKPYRRLRLTLPSGLSGARVMAEDSPQRDRVEATFYLPKTVVSAIEEEWWRRQNLGEDYSRSDIVRAAVEHALTNIERLTKALQQMGLAGTA